MGSEQNEKETRMFITCNTLSEKERCRGRGFEVTFHRTIGKPGIEGLALR